MKKGFLLISIFLVINALGVSATGSDGSGYIPRSQDGPTAEAYLHGLRSNQHTGIVNSSDVIEAVRQVNEMNTLRNQANLNWTPLGPDNYGGKTKGIIYDRKDASGKTIIAGSTGGGIWQSTNEGITWQSVGTLNLMVSSMVQTPNGDIYVGTGDGFNAQLTGGLNDMGYTTGFMGSGIWKSTDGTNFTQLQATVPQMNNNTAAWAFINELGVNSDGHVFAATNAGLRFSTNGGTSWQMAKTAAGAELSLNATDVQVGSDKTLLAVVDNKAYVSKNGNPESFVLISTAEVNTLPTADVSRLEMAIAPSNPNIMYAVLVNNFGIHIGIYRSADKGDNWEVILPATTTVNIFNQRGIYNNYIAVFPNDPDRVLIGGQNIWQGRRVVPNGLFAWDLKSSPGASVFNPFYVHFGQQRVVFKPGSSTSFFLATDGGIHKGEVSGQDLLFTTSNRNYMTSQFYTVAPSGGENRVLGGAHDQGTIFISGEGNTVRQGETLYTRTSSGGPCVVSTIDPNAIVVTSTAGSMQRSEDMAFTFSTQFLLATGFGNTQAFRTPVALWESYNDQNSRDSITFRARRPYQAGEVIKAKSSNNDHPFLYTLPNALNTGDTIRIKDIVATKLFITVANRLWMTKEFLNFGKTPTWFELSNSSVGFTGIPQSMAVSADGNHVFVGMRDGKLFRISNISLAYNAALADINSPQSIIATRQMQLNLPGTSTPVSQAITSIAIDPKNPNNVMVTLANYGNNDYVFVTNNALDANPGFLSKQGNLPKMPVYSSLFEMSTPGLAIIGTELGVFTTSDVFASNPNWVPDQNMANLPVFDLKQQLINKTADTVQLINVDTLVVHYPGTNNLGIIYGATFGRGLVRCNDYRKPVGINETPVGNRLNQISLGIAPNPMIGESTVSLNLQNAGNVKYTVYDLNGRVVRLQQLGMYPAGEHNFLIDNQGLKKGTYLLKVESGSHSGVVKFLVY